MAVYIPSVDELTTKFKNNYASNLGIDVSELGDSYIVESKVQASAVYSIYLKLSKVQNNIYPDLAEEDVLLRIGYSLLGRYPTPASQGVYTITATGTGTINAQTQFVANNDTAAAGYLYITDSSQSVPGTVTVRSLTTGIEPLLTVGDKLTSLQPLVGIENEVVVATVTTIPVAAESIESYRDDVLEIIRILPQGGAPGDYRLWCLEIGEVRTVYPYVYNTAGDIIIYVEATPENTLSGQPVGVSGGPVQSYVYLAPGVNPESGKVIWDNIKMQGRKPLTVQNIYTSSVLPKTVDVNFIGLSDETISGELKTAIDVLLYEIRPYVAGAQAPTTKNDILTIGMIIAEISSVLSGTGITYTSVTMDIGSFLHSEFTFVFGKYPYLRTINNDGSPI